MSEVIEERVVSMEFDNEDFEKNINQSIQIPYVVAILYLYFLFHANYSLYNIFLLHFPFLNQIFHLVFLQKNLFLLTFLMFYILIFLIIDI